MGLSMKNYGGSLKNPIFIGRLTKNQCIGGGLPKKDGLGQFVDLRSCLTKKRRWCFWRVVDTTMHTMKLDALLHKTCIKVLRLDICTSAISLSKIEHQRRNDHLFRQRNKATELAVGLGVGCHSEGEWTKFEKQGLSNIGGGWSS